MDLKIGQVGQVIYRYMSRNKPLMIHGAPGIGKSDSVRQQARKIAEEKKMEFLDGGLDKNKYCLIDIRVSQLDPSDLRGIPMPADHEITGDDGQKTIMKRTQWLVPSWLPTEGEGVLFLDEINLAPPSIQASAYQLILDRRLGDYVLPDGWTIVAAGNRAEDQANVFPMAAPLKNRFSHTTLLVPTEEEWRDWAMENDIAPEIVAFMAFKPNMLFNFNKDTNAFPTPRTWALTSHMIKDVKDIDEIYILASTCVGQGAAMEFQGFIKLRKKINLDELLKSPKKIKDLKDPGLMYSAISGLAEKYNQDGKLMNSILGVVEHIENAEFGVFLLRMMKGMKPSKFSKDLMGAKNWEKLFGRYKKFIL